MTDEDGDATFERELNFFCPLEAAENGVNGNELLTIATHLHSDGVAYSGLPAPIAGGAPPGTVLHAVLEWNMGDGISVAGPDEDDSDDD